MRSCERISTYNLIAAFNRTDRQLPVQMTQWSDGGQPPPPFFFSLSHHPLCLSQFIHNGWTRATTKCFSFSFVISIHRDIILGQRVIFLITVCHICGFKDNCAPQNMGSISAINIQMHGCLLLCLLKRVASSFAWEELSVTICNRVVLDSSVCVSICNANKICVN